MSSQGEPDAAEQMLATATPARIYDYFLGGYNNFPVDRVAGDRVIAALGKTLTRSVVRENRLFLGRAVRYLAEAGIEQFIDIGAGLPTRRNTHQVAQEVDPDARVVYVDNDPLVLAHGEALLATDHHTKVITADMRDPQAILNDPVLNALVDFSAPVAVLFVAVLHFTADVEGPGRIVAAFREWMTPGSYVAISHLTSDGPPSEQRQVCEDSYADTAAPMLFRSGREILGLFDGFELVDPGRLVRPWRWHPEARVGPRTTWLYAGVGHKIDSLERHGVPVGDSEHEDHRDRAAEDDRS